MKNIIHIFFFFALPVLLYACKEDESATPTINCLLTKETTSSTSHQYITEYIYDEDNITKMQTSYDGVIPGYNAFTYDGNNHVTQSLYFSLTHNTWAFPATIIYNNKGKWSKIMRIWKPGEVTITEAEYNDQNQIIKYTSSTDKGGKITVDYTITYEWQGGNNILYTFTNTNTNYLEIKQYEYDLSRENKNRMAQEKLAFEYSEVKHNKNLYKRIKQTINYKGNSSKLIYDYSYQYNEDGYPTELIRKISPVTNSSLSVTEKTEFLYSCK